MQNLLTLHFSSFLRGKEAPITKVSETKSD